MKLLIIEDEQPAARRLKRLLEAIQPGWTVLDVIDSVEDAVAWFNSFDAPDLVFMDIELADGQSFAIFDQVKLDVPVIFTTAYDQYAVKAFRVNGMDYLLKPIEQGELKEAIGKFERLTTPEVSPDYAQLLNMIRAESNATAWKERFMIKVGDQLKFVAVGEVAYFYSDAGSTSLVTVDGREFVVDYTLDQLKEMLDPASWCRINRKCMVGIKSIVKIHSWFNSRLKLELKPAAAFDVIVARERVGDFKVWLDS